MFKKISAIVFLVLVLAVSASAQKQQIGSVVMSGIKSLVFTKEGFTVTGTKLYVRTVDGKFEAKAQKMVFQFVPGGNTLQSATLTGNVWILVKPEPTKTTEASADKADVDWLGTKEAVLTGDVTIKSKDPSMFVGPATITADRAYISLKSDAELQPGESRLRFESDDSNTTVQFTPAQGASEQGQKSDNKNK